MASGTCLAAKASSAEKGAKRTKRLAGLGRPLADMGSSWERIRKMLGLGPDCVNGGTKDNQGNCSCTKWYEGELCQEILCANGGRANKARTECHCPDSRRHHGTHCAQTVCDNSGRDRGDGTCACVDDWYTGRFCQHYSSPWGVLFGAAGALLLLLVVLCVLCRLRPCSRPARRRRRRPSLSGSATPPLPPPGRLRALPPTAPPDDALPPPYPPLPKIDAPPPAYCDVVRDLDKYPTSNPLSAATSPPASEAAAAAENSVNQRLLSGQPVPAVVRLPLGYYPDERDEYDHV